MNQRGKYGSRQVFILGEPSRSAEDAPTSALVGSLPIVGAVLVVVGAIIVGIMRHGTIDRW